VFRFVETPDGSFRIVGMLTVGSSIVFQAAGLDVQPLIIELLKTLSLEFDTGWTLHRDGARIGFVENGRWQPSKKPPEPIPFASEKKGCLKIMIFALILALACWFIDILW
jgi:hypothetical protein